MQFSKRMNNQGISVVAVVVVVAAIAGGAYWATSETSTKNDSAATSTDKTSVENETAPNTIFTCSDGSEIVADFATDGTAEITLPSGDVRSVTQADANAGERYASADGDFVFSRENDQLQIQQDGEVVHQECIATGSPDDENGTSTTSATETDAAATSATGVDADAGAEVEIDASADVGATQE